MYIRTVVESSPKTIVQISYPFVGLFNTDLLIYKVIPLINFAVALKSTSVNRVMAEKKEIILCYRNMFNKLLKNVLLLWIIVGLCYQVATQIGDDEQAPTAAPTAAPEEAAPIGFYFLMERDDTGEDDTGED
uniref:Uncharacterized protein n=1 Tax=Glossina pallidipes TaxID=7398 RepID=A0A1A9ZUU8_GLOPL